MKIELKMKERDVSITDLVEETGLSRNRCKEIIDCYRAASAEEASLIAEALETRRSCIFVEEDHEFWNRERKKSRRV
jgi:cyanate lyase